LSPALQMVLVLDEPALLTSDAAPLPQPFSKPASIAARPPNRLLWIFSGQLL
jgi:hypothetical protein